MGTHEIILKINNVIIYLTVSNNLPNASTHFDRYFILNVVFNLYLFTRPD